MSPKTRITVGGTRRRVSLEATIDTGFDGDLSIPVDTAITLGLDLIGQVEVELADGSIKREVILKGFAVFLGKKRVVEILLTRGHEALLGTNMLAKCKLTMDFDSGAVEFAQ